MGYGNAYGGKKKKVKLKASAFSDVAMEEVLSSKKDSK